MLPPLRLIAFSSCPISIYALVKRATDIPSTSRCLCKYFNPRPREEGDSGRSNL
nr:MAG TPA: hypothetical protein [Caudoviricetes sp.]